MPHLHGPYSFVSQCTLHVVFEPVIEKDAPAKCAYTGAKISIRGYPVSDRGWAARTRAGDNLDDAHRVRFVDFVRN